MRRMILLAFTLSVAGLTSHAAEFVDGGSSYNPYVPANARMSSADQSVGEDDPGDLAEQNPTRSYVPRTRHHKRRAHKARSSVNRSSRSPLFVAACDRFVTRADKLGDLGKIVQSAIQKSKYRDKFLAGSGIQRYCPAFRKDWSADKKYLAWAAFWESLGSVESACGTDPQTYKADKKEIGIWQLERFHNRNRIRAPICQHIHTVADEAACAISIMGDIQFKKNRPVEYYNSYWGPIRYQTVSDLLPRMRRFAFCN